MSTASQSVRPLSLPNDLSPGATSHCPCNGVNIAQDRLKERENPRTQGKCYRNATTINTLTDNVLVEIFDFCRLGEDHVQLEYSSRTVWKWNLLVHVCRRWRQIIFASPRRLHLENLCTNGTPVGNDLGIWPDIPIVMRYGIRDTIPFDDEDNVIAALEHPDRLCRIGLHMTGSGSQLGVSTLHFLPRSGHADRRAAPITPIVERFTYHRSSSMSSSLAHPNLALCHMQLILEESPTYKGTSSSTLGRQILLPKTLPHFHYFCALVLSRDLSQIYTKFTFCP
ncbi:hypothetical protein EDB92DRAFT_170656 [Lactarius akahatsu]|uniref:F-box domain-containing protein n=1 Tax=Lactarius akahatsu TaxID=416441 RepID=A0AAD4L5Z4_9AGAM|nr:hypothetical protein EDB92DRAFT_170656 [Lactarius akahatsu]